MYSSVRNCVRHFMQQASQIRTICSSSLLTHPNSCQTAPKTRLNLTGSLFCAASDDHKPSTKLFANLSIQKHDFHCLQQISKTLDADHQLLSYNLMTVMEHVPLRTFKMRTVLKKRCKDCYFSRFKGQWMVLCKTHPRHKQRKIMPPAKTKWILTHATQGPWRPW